MKTSEGKPATPEDIVQALDAAVDSLLNWVTDWHSPLVTDAVNKRRHARSSQRHLDAFEAWFETHRHDGIVNQPSVQRLHRISMKIREVSESMAGAGTPPSEAEYRDLMGEVRAFVAQARRLERAFAVASSELDALTGVQNRQAMKRALEYERQRQARNEAPAVVAIADLDHFKAVNDDYGHAVGDVVLTVAAARLSESVRAYDQVFRFGGEEFVVLLPESDLAHAVQIVERLRLRLERDPVELDDGRSIAVTASFGVAALGPDETVERTLERADAALYRAKEAGRNCVEVDG